MDDLDQIARNALAPGVGVRLRAVSDAGNKCFVGDEKGTAGVREWMEDAKRQHGETEFIMEAVDKHAEVIRILWAGSV
jgi:hypothetical protein